jgi:hypothetical protein
MLRRLLSLTLVGVALAASPALANVDQRAYDQVLHTRVTNGFVDYHALGGPADRQALEGYLAGIADAPLPASRADRLAAWINAYNALVLQGILDGKSPASLLGRGMFFLTGKHRVYGQELTLTTLENDMLRKGFADPRIHAAIVCGSKSCPPLRSEAFVGAKIDSQLDDQMQRFLHDLTKNRFDKATKTLQLSSIFNWFKGDFAAAGGVPAFVAHYLSPAERSWVTGPGVKIQYLDYDWTLNGRK